MTAANTTGKPRKSTNAVIAARVDEVLRIRIDGAGFHDIRRYAAENGWGVSDRQLERYIGKADRLLRERLERKASRLRALTVAKMRNLYARAVQAADYRTALACLQAEAKLLGLYPDNRELVGQLRELLKRLDAMEARTATRTAPADERLPQAFEKAAG